MGRPRKDGTKPPALPTSSRTPKAAGAAKAPGEPVEAKPGGRTLPAEIVSFIIERLAQYAGPTEIRKEIMDLYDGRDVPKATINRYNPNTAQGEKELSETLKALFFERRALYLERLDNIPIANAAVRLQKIQDVVDRCEANSNDVLLLQATKQAAEERGGAYTNRRELTGANGGSVKVEGVAPIELSFLSDEELATYYALTSKAASAAQQLGQNAVQQTSAK